MSYQIEKFNVNSTEAYLTGVDFQKSRTSLRPPSSETIDYAIKSKSNIAFMSVQSIGLIVVDGMSITFKPGLIDIYGESSFYRTNEFLTEAVTITVYSGSGIILFDRKTKTFKASSNQYEINADHLLIGINNANLITLFATQYMYNGNPRGLIYSESVEALDVYKHKYLPGISYVKNGFVYTDHIKVELNDTVLWKSYCNPTEVSLFEYDTNFVYVD